MSKSQSEQLWTPANIVTLTRILLVPVFVAVLLTPWPALFEQVSWIQIAQPWAAALFFVVLALTDSLDGYLARSRNEITTFGKFMDPLADKLLVCSALIALVELGILPSWVVIIIIARDFIMSGVRLVAASKGEVIAASWYGKFKTAFQMVAIVMFLVAGTMPELLGYEFGQTFIVLTWVTMGVALVLTVVSLIDYFYHARFLLGFGSKQASGEDATTECSAGENKSVSGKNGSLPACGAPLAEVLLSRANTLATEIISRAKAAQITIATCESLTGGLIGATLTAVPGSSAVVAGGLITYTSENKTRLAAVSEGRLAATGPVDDLVAEQMAQGSKEACKASWGIAVTGIAGPTGEEPGKPVGTVCFGYAFEEEVTSECVVFSGDREQVRLQTVCHALERVLERLG